MLTIDVKHPDVLHFLKVKKTPNWVTNQIIEQCNWSGLFDEFELDTIKKQVMENTQVRFANISIKVSDEFMDAVNEELIDEIVGQTVDIYKISVERTNENLYGESTAKYFNVGFRVNCLIQFNEPETTLDDYGSDLNTSVEMYFHRTTLKEADFYPEIGDIVDWNSFYFEINSVTEPQLIAGHQNYQHQIKATAHRSRLSSLQIEERPR